MSYRRIFALVGWIVMILGLAMCAVAVFSGLTEVKSHPGVPTKWLSCCVAVIVFSLALIVVGRGKKSSMLFVREAVAVAALSWIFCSLACALPLMGVGAMSAPSALFEAVSCITTTGASSVKNVEAFPPSLNLWRCLANWVGGLGVVFLFVAVLGAGGRRLMHSEASTLSSDNLQPQIRRVAWSYMMIYGLLSLLCFIGYLLSGIDVFHAICFTMTTVSTGGTAPVGDLSSVFSTTFRQLWATVMMILGGIAFPLHYQVWVLRRWGLLARDLELRVYLSALLVVTFFVVINLKFTGTFNDWGRDIVTSLFHVTAIITTTGYAYDNFAAWPDFSQLLLVTLMIIGGCAGSTSGGLKVSRILIFWHALLIRVQSSFSPRRVSNIRYGRDQIPDHVVYGVISYVGLYFAVMLVGVVVLALLDAGQDMETLVSAVVACFNNVGPGLGFVGPMSNYSILSWSSQFWLSFLMLLGRLEILVLLALLLPSFWKKF